LPTPPFALATAKTCAILRVYYDVNIKDVPRWGAIDRPLALFGDRNGKQGLY